MLQRSTFLLPQIMTSAASDEQTSKALISMSLTNDFTADAATQTLHGPIRPMRLLGVFQSPDNAHVLLKTDEDGVFSLSQLTPNGGLRLIETGDGWAMIEDGARIHRLVIG